MKPLVSTLSDIKTVGDDAHIVPSKIYLLISKYVGAVKNKLGFVEANPWQQPLPPSDEGGGFLRKQKVGGREIKPHKTATFSLPQSRFARQLPRQREPKFSYCKHPYKPRFVYTALYSIKYILTFNI